MEILGMSKPLETIDKLEVARRLCLKDREGNVSERAVDDRLYADPGFPRPRKLGKYNLWLSEEIDEYIRDLPLAGETKRAKKPKRAKS